MLIENVNNTQIQAACVALSRCAEQAGQPVIKYIDCGTRIIKLVCHSPRFMDHVERQMACSLKDYADHFDATLVIWQEEQIENATQAVCKELDDERYKIMSQPDVYPESENLRHEQIVFYNEDIVRFFPIVNVDPPNHYLMAWNPQKSVWYYAEQNLDAEEFIKRGHIFVQIIFRICNVPGSSLAHGAVIGLNNTGIIFCALGYRGKSTLCVRALIDGFDYVSDDYFILGRKGGESLKAWPIYSVVALAPQAYSDLYCDFNGKFLCNNGRKDKYMFNISAYHNNFRYGYPVKIAMFPHICDCTEPSIEPGFRELALEELCFSTLNNTGNQRDAETVGKLWSFVTDLPFYRFNLCKDSRKNTEFLRKFLESRNDR